VRNSRQSLKTKLIIIILQRRRYTMNKAELIEAVSKKTDLSKSKVNDVLEEILKNVMKGAKKGSMQLVGFGTFKEVKRKARVARVPGTDRTVKVPAKKVITFKASKNPKY
jgi:DNA-binding protein HU-beta